MKVKNLVSTNGNKIANQFEITHNGITYFQSYNSMIAKLENGKLILGCDWDYSVTTLKYLYIWMQENCWTLYNSLPSGKSRKDSINKAIASGKITYDGGMY